MKVKGLLGVLGTLCIATCAVGFTSCGESHTHDFTAKKITKYYLVEDQGTHGCENEKEYYYACKTEGCEEKSTEKFSYHYTEKSNQVVKDGGSCTKKMQYYYTCAECSGHGEEYYEWDFAHTYDEKGDCTQEGCDAHVSLGLEFGYIEDKQESNVFYYGVTGMGTCTDTDIVIPFQNDGEKVVAIGALAFQGNKSITSVKFGENVTYVVDNAFKGCTALKEVTFAENNSLSVLGDYVFQGCSSLETVSFPDTLKSYSSYLFAECYRLKDFVIKETVNSIGAETFRNCDSLTEIVIPDNLSSIGVSAFKDCDALTIYSSKLKRRPNWSVKWNSTDCPVVWSSNETEVANDENVYAVVDGVRYAFKDGKATVVRQSKSTTIEKIPSKVSYKGTEYTVSSIAKQAF